MSGHRVENKNGKLYVTINGRTTALSYQEALGVLNKRIGVALYKGRQETLDQLQEAYKEASNYVG